MNSFHHFQELQEKPPPLPSDSSFPPDFRKAYDLEKKRNDDIIKLY